MPGVKEHCLARFNHVPAAAHHVVTREYLDPHYPNTLRLLVDDIDEAGGNVAPLLQNAIQQLQAIPCDDVVAEEPHARARRTVLPTPNHKFPWLAASTRLEANLRDAEELPSVLNKDLQTEWDRWSSVIKFRRTERAIRMKRSDVEARVYFLQQRPHLADGGSESGDTGDEPHDSGSDGNGKPPPSHGGGDDPDDDSSGGDSRHEPKRRRTGGEGDEGGDGGEDDGGGDGRGSRVDLSTRPNARSRATIQLREWLKAALQKYQYITITVPQETVDSGAGAH